LPDATIAQRYFNSLRTEANVLDLDAEANIHALTHEFIKGTLQIGPAKQNITAERLCQRRRMFAAQESSLRSIEVNLFKRGGVVQAYIEYPHPAHHLHSIALE